MLARGPHPGGCGVVRSLRAALGIAAVAAAALLAPPTASAEGPRTPDPGKLLRRVTTRYQALRTLEGRFELSAVAYGHLRVLRGAFAWEADGRSALFLEQSDGERVLERVRSGELFATREPDGTRESTTTDADPPPPPPLTLLAALDASKLHLAAIGGAKEADQARDRRRIALIEAPLRAPHAPFVAGRLHLDVGAHRLIACEFLDARGDALLSIVFLDERANQPLEAASFAVAASEPGATARAPRKVR